MAVPPRSKKEKPAFTPGSLAILLVSVVSIGLLGGALVLLIQKERKPPPPPPSKSQAPQNTAPTIKPEKVEQIPVQKMAKMESEKPSPPPPSPTVPPPPVPSPVLVPKQEPTITTAPGGNRRPLRVVSKSRVPKKQVRGAAKRYGQESSAEEKSTPPAGGLRAVVPAFTVQVASYTDEGKAQNLSDRLKEQGYDAYVQAGTVNHKTYYRVRVGEFDTREKAGIIARRLHEKGASPPFVTPYRR